MIAVPIAAVVAWGWYGALWFRRHRFASRICKNLRTLNRDSGQLRPLLLEFTSKEIDEQPAPQSQRSDDRYALLEKLQLILRTIGYPGLIVIIDRVDEPDLVNGQAERMKQLVWPLMDNKLLKHENFGIKMLLPSDLQPFAERETREFHERARLDKQNVVASFDWTGEALYDLLGSRMKACAIFWNIAFTAKVFQFRNFGCPFRRGPAVVKNSPKCIPIPLPTHRRTLQTVSVGIAEFSNLKRIVRVNTGSLSSRRPSQKLIDNPASTDDNMACRSKA